MKSIPAKVGPPRRRGGCIVLLGAAAAAALWPSLAHAHAFGARYDLPLPLDFYLFGAGAAVAFSFVVMALVFRTRQPESALSWPDLAVFKPVRALLHPAVGATLGAVAVALYLLVLGAGFFGRQETIKNFAPTFVWIVWWVGFAYFAALLGNLWPAVNPWAVLFTWAEKASMRLRGKRLSLALPYPARLGVWPAAVLFWCFAWFELISESGRLPAVLATAAMVYSAITWSAMFVFGRGAWLARGEAFSLAFDVLGRFAPLGGPGDGSPRLFLRPYAGALVTKVPCRVSVTAFVLLMLSTVTFDGFKETPLWGTLLRTVAAAPTLHPLIRSIHDLGFDLDRVLQSLMLALFPAVFVLVYLGFAWLTRRAAADSRPVIAIAGLFVYSLVPIAIAYHLAHYLSYLILGGQFIIPLLSDPLGLGWDLFGTAGYKTDIGLIDAKFVWYMSVASIVGGHVIAVGVAHFTALEAFDDPRKALRSQYPLLVLMVGYTVVSLWILSQPIVATGNIARLRAAADTVTLTPFEFRERCYVMSPGEMLRYRFSADRAVQFDIHYHDGLKIHYPVKFSGTATPEGTFRADANRSYCLMWSNQSLSKTTVTYAITGPTKP